MGRNYVIRITEDLQSFSSDLNGNNGRCGGWAGAQLIGSSPGKGFPKMENKAFYIKYLTNQPVKVETHIDTQRALRDFPLTDVGDLISAYRPNSLLANTPLELLTLHLPEDAARSALSEEFFASADKTNTTLDPGCPLSTLGSLGTKSKEPLIIKSRNGAGQGIVHGLTVGNEMEVDIITPEEAVSNIVQSIRLDDENKNIFSAQESMENINLNDSILNLEIKSLDGVPNLLYSEEFYPHEKEIGIEMPIDRLANIVRKVIVLIGVSGCGKTRTCYDLCREYWGLYFDCTVDLDFATMIDELEVKRPRFKTEESQQIFEEGSKRLIKCLLAARLLVLQTLYQRNPNLKSFEWLCIQRSRRSQELFSRIFTALCQLPWSVSSVIYQKLKDGVPKPVRVIFDESQHTLDLLKFDYRSTSSNQQCIKANGHFAFPRPFFSFLSRIVIKSGFNSIWCGTQMRIRSMDLIYSAAGLKPEEIYIFTDFSFLEPTHIFKLLCKWLKVEVSNNVALFEEISNVLQGRPRFFTSFLHKLINSSDINNCFRSYVNEMTTNFDSSLSSSSPYFFWQQRIDWSIQPIEKTSTYSFETRLVSDTLIKLCLSFLFGNGSSIVYSPDLDLVSTSLVMVAKKSNEWHAKMSEPIVLSAGLNYLADVNAQILMEYFANRLFLPLGPPNMTPQERGHMMEFVIALRFIQGWWLEANLQQYLPKWAKNLNIQKPLGVIDCRSKESSVNMFVQQLRNSNYPWVIFPSVNAGPDLRYSIFCCYIKTTSTPKSQSTIYVDAEECRKNVETMNPANWYSSQKSVQEDCLPAINNGQQFIHIRFELPYTAQSMKDNFINEQKGNDYFICVNLDSPFAQDFFGDSFVKKYREFVSRLLGT